MSTPDSSKADLALYVPPIAWAAQLGANYALEPVSCHQDTRMYMWTVSALALFACAFAAWKGWTVWQQFRRAEPADRDASSVEFLALSGLTLSSLFGLVIIAQAIPTFFFVPCQ